MKIINCYLLKFLTLSLIFSFSNFVFSQSESINRGRIKNDKIKKRTGDKAYIRYRPNPDEPLNLILIDKKEVSLAIPVTNNNLLAEADRIFNISTKTINALLVVLDGNDGNETKKAPVIDHIKTVIPFKKIKKKGMWFRSRLKRDNKMLIVVVHDNIIGKKDSTGYCYVKYLQGEVGEYKDYRDIQQNWNPQLKEYSCGNDNRVLEITKPKENDGDVIGGNG